jgi:hypothetical protein
VPVEVEPKDSNDDIGLRGVDDGPDPSSEDLRDLRETRARPEQAVIGHG